MITLSVDAHKIQHLSVFLVVPNCTEPWASYEGQIKPWLRCTNETLQYISPKQKLNKRFLVLMLVLLTNFTMKMTQGLCMPKLREDLIYSGNILARRSSWDLLLTFPAFSLCSDNTCCAGWATATTWRMATFQKKSSIQSLRREREILIKLHQTVHRRNDSGSWTAQDKDANKLKERRTANPKDHKL